MMNTTKEQRKEQAVKFMKELGIYKPYIDGFINNDQVCFFEGFGGFWAEQEEDLYEKMKEIEKRYDSTVYAITHEMFEFGECYSFLLVTDYVEEWEELVYGTGSKHSCFAYVWNKDCEWCSEFGSVGILSLGGGIRRIA